VGLLPSVPQCSSATTVDSTSSFFGETAEAVVPFRINPGPDPVLDFSSAFISTPYRHKNSFQSAYFNHVSCKRLSIDGRQADICLRDQLFAEAAFLPAGALPIELQAGHCRILGDMGILICQGSHAFDVDPSFPLARLV